MSKEDQLKGTFVPAIYVEKLGPAGGMLLGQIVYWHAKATKGENWWIVHRYGYRWMAHTYKQLAAETGLSLSSIKSQVCRLKAEGIVHVEQHRHNNIVPCHFRFDQDCPDWVGEGLPPGWSVSRLVGMAENANPSKEETKLKTKQEYSVHCTPPSTKLIEKKNKGQTSAAEHCSTEGGHVGPVALGDIFREAWKDEYPTTVLPPFETKELGQFKNIIEKCPQGAAPEVVDYAVRNWSEFCGHAQAYQGAFNLPQLSGSDTRASSSTSAASSTVSERSRAIISRQVSSFAILFAPFFEDCLQLPAQAPAMQMRFNHVTLLGFQRQAKFLHVAAGSVAGKFKGSVDGRIHGDGAACPR